MLEIEITENLSSISYKSPCPSISSAKNTLQDPINLIECNHTIDIKPHDCRFCSLPDSKEIKSLFEGKIAIRYGKTIIHIDVQSGVFPPSFDSFFLLRTLYSNGYYNRSDIDCVCDLGCGSGIVGIAIANMNRFRHLVATDINQKALETTRHNITFNEINKNCLTSLYHTKGLDGIMTDRSNTLIVSAPPYFPRVFQELYNVEIDERGFDLGLLECLVKSAPYVSKEVVFVCSDSTGDVIKNIIRGSKYEEKIQCKELDNKIVPFSFPGVTKATTDLLFKNGWIYRRSNDQRFAWWHTIRVYSLITI